MKNADLNVVNDFVKNGLVLSKTGSHRDFKSQFESYFHVSHGQI